MTGRNTAIVERWRFRRVHARTRRDGPSQPSATLSSVFRHPGLDAQSTSNRSNPCTHHGCCWCSPTGTSSSSSILWLLSTRTQKHTFCEKNLAPVSLKFSNDFNIIIRIWGVNLTTIRTLITAPFLGIHPTDTRHHVHPGDCSRHCRSRSAPFPSPGVVLSDPLCCSDSGRRCYCCVHKGR